MSSSSLTSCSEQAAEWGVTADRSAAETDCAASPIGSLATWQALNTTLIPGDLAGLQQCIGVQRAAAAGSVCR